MPITTYRARVSEHTLIKGKFQYVTFELIEPKTIEFTAGQFIMLNIPGMAAKRSYSIASNPRDNYKIEILVDIGPQGDGALYLQSLNPGEEVAFMGPAGRFIVESDPTEQKLSFIATGSGISAIRSMILDELQTRQDVRPTILHWGMRYPQDIFWEDAFRELDEYFQNFHFDLVLSQAPAHWPLCVGHVTDCLQKHYQDFSHTGYYLCGNKRMIDETVNLLKSKNVSETNIHHELFY